MASVADFISSYAVTSAEILWAVQVVIVYIW